MKRNDIVTLLGGSGFIGSNIVKEIAKTGVRIKVVGHRASAHSELRVCGYVGQIALVDSNLLDDKQLKSAIAGSDVVINLIGILFEKRAKTFEKMHVELASKIAKLCYDNKIKKLIHFSALGVDKAITSKYAISKCKGEAEVKKHYPNAIILRPSVVFGANDDFINKFNWMSKIMPFLPLIGGGHTMFQPVYVGDVSKAVSNILKDTGSKHVGKIYELAGPQKISFKEILRLILKVSGRKRFLIYIPHFIARIKAWFFEFMPKPLLTRDQLELLKYDNVTKKSALSELGVKASELEPIIRTYVK